MWERGDAGTRFMRGLFEKSPLHPKNFPERFLLCDGVSVISGLRYCQLLSGTSKTLPALAEDANTPIGKVLVKLFQKLARSRASSHWRAPQSAKSPDRRFFLIDFSLRLLLAKKNRLWNTEGNTGTRLCGGRGFFVRKLLERSFPTPFKNFPERIFIV